MFGNVLCDHYHHHETSVSESKTTVSGPGSGAEGAVTTPTLATNDGLPMSRILMACNAHSFTVYHHDQSQLIPLVCVVASTPSPPISAMLKGSWSIEWLNDTKSATLIRRIYKGITDDDEPWHIDPYHNRGDRHRYKEPLRYYHRYWTFELYPLSVIMAMIAPLTLPSSSRTLPDDLPIIQLSSSSASFICRDASAHILYVTMSNGRMIWWNGSAFGSYHVLTQRSGISHEEVNQKISTRNAPRLIVISPPTNQRNNTSSSYDHDADVDDTLLIVSCRHGDPLQILVWLAAVNNYGVITDVKLIFEDVGPLKIHPLADGTFVIDTCLEWRHFDILPVSSLPLSLSAYVCRNEHVAIRATGSTTSLTTDRHPSMVVPCIRYGRALVTDVDDQLATYFYQHHVSLTSSSSSSISSLISCGGGRMAVMAGVGVRGSGWSGFGVLVRYPLQSWTQSRYSLEVWQCLNSINDASITVHRRLILVANNNLFGIHSINDGTRLFITQSHLNDGPRSSSGSQSGALVMSVLDLDALFKSPTVPTQSMKPVGTDESKLTTLPPFINAVHFVSGKEMIGSQKAMPSTLELLSKAPTFTSASTVARFITTLSNRSASKLSTSSPSTARASQAQAQAHQASASVPLSNFNITSICCLPPDPILIITIIQQLTPFVSSTIVSLLPLILEYACS
jgi:hypothetical protein